MKKYIIISILIIAIFFFQSCSTTKKVPYNAMVSQVSDDNAISGVIHLRSAGKGKKEEDAISDAEKNAFNALLFVGIPNSSQQRPMISDESSAKSSNPVYFENFFDKKGYRDFITSIANSGFGKDKDDDMKTTNIDVRINFIALRTNLENNNIIRKFGL